MGVFETDSTVNYGTIINKDGHGHPTLVSLERKIFPATQREGRLSESEGDEPLWLYQLPGLGGGGGGLRSTWTQIDDNRKA